MFERFLKARAYASLTLIFLLIWPTLSSSATAGEVNIYSYREPGLLAPLLNAFTTKTGIKTNIVFADGGLIERAAAEGSNSPVDVILTTGVGRLADAKALGITQAINDNAIKENVPANYRDPDGHWIGLSQRARIIYASKERVSDNTINYADLADKKWHGRICARSGQHPYNIALLASVIANDGANNAEKWARAVKENLARKPSGMTAHRLKESSPASATSPSATAITWRRCRTTKKIRNNRSGQSQFASYSQTPTIEAHTSMSPAPFSPSMHQTNKRH